MGETVGTHPRFRANSGFRIVATRSTERVNFLDETVAALSQSQAGDFFLGRTAETLPQSCADTVAGNFAPRSAERSDLSGETVEAFPLFRPNPAVESTVLQSY